MHGIVKFLYWLLTNDATLVIAFTAAIVFFLYQFYKNNPENKEAQLCCAFIFAAVLFWMLVDMSPAENVLLSLFSLAAASAVLSYIFINRKSILKPVGESVSFDVMTIFLAVIFVVLILKAAWLGDDSFITFRTVDNFINGYGLTWNVDERVQAYTNTLWMFAVSVLYFITRDIFISSMLLSAIFTGLALYCLKKTSSGKAAFVVVFFGLIMSKAFVDYTTSGLENPLTFFLLAVFYWMYFEEKEAKNKTFWLTVISSAVFLNKPDVMILIVFPLLYHFFLEKQKAILPALAGFVPVFLWEIFSVIYYGFPLPNTFYTKLFAGVPAMDTVVQGLKYAANSVAMDPLTLSLAFGGILAGFYPVDPQYKKKRLFAVGIILYVLYVIKAGGDFMSGRFFTPASFTGALLVSGIAFDRVKNSWYPAFALIIFLGLFSPYYSASRAFTPQKYFYGSVSNVTDERQYYFLDAYNIKSVLSEVVKQGTTKLDFAGFARDGLRLKAYSGENGSVSRAVAAGMRGFFAGPKAYIMDEAALADAFMARVPFDGTRWRPGHVSRVKIGGYEESIKQQKNLIEDAKYAPLYDKIQLITRGPLFTKERWKAIWDVNTGNY